MLAPAAMADGNCARAVVFLHGTAKGQKTLLLFLHLLHSTTGLVPCQCLSGAQD